MWIVPSRPAARQHMRQHGKIWIFGTKNSSYEWVRWSFFGNFPEAFGWMFYHPFDFFWYSGGPRTFLEWSWIDLGNIIFWPKFSLKSRPFMLIKAPALRHLESIVLSKPSVIPNQNNSFECRKNVSAQTNVAISRFSHFGVSIVQNVSMSRQGPPWLRITLTEHRKYALRVIGNTKAE